MEEKEPVNFAERLDLIKFVDAKLLELAKRYMKTSHPPKPYFICECECCGEVQFELDDVLYDEEILYCRKKKLDKDFYIGLRKGISCRSPTMQRKFY